MVAATGVLELLENRIERQQRGNVSLDCIVRTKEWLLDFDCSAIGCFRGTSF
jgi:hypothetical protein